METDGDLRNDSSGDAEMELDDGAANKDESKTSLPQVEEKKEEANMVRHGVRDTADERPRKKQRVAACDENFMRWVQHEISGVKEGLERVAAEAREDRRAVHKTLQRLLREIQQRP